MSIKKGVIALAVCSLVCVASLGLRGTAMAQHDAAKGEAAKISKAVAILIHTKKGQGVEGRATFTPSNGTMHVHAEISGLTPGDHGFHIHEFGVWSDDGMASGGHFNPTMQKHAGIDTPKRHVGDLGNITANASGKATLDLDDRRPLSTAHLDPRPRPGRSSKRPTISRPSPQAMPAAGLLSA